MTAETYIELAERQRLQLSRLATDFLHDEASAEDVVQESLLRLWLMRERIDTPQDFCALAVRITKNVCISLWRKKQKLKAVPLEALGALEGTSESASLEEQENHQRLRQAIDTLPPSERRIFQLWQQDLTTQEIAAITGATPRTVSSMLSLARKKIFAKLKSQTTE